MKIGLTGNIASGKSTLAQMLGHRGFHVIDADREAHRLYEQEPQLRQDLALEFGSSILDAEGQIHRPTLANLVFAQPQRLERLNQMVRPLLRRHLLHTLDEASCKYPHVFMEAALLFEGSWAEHFDEIWLVWADDQLRLSRAIQRGHSPIDAQGRIDAQMSQEVKKNLAHRTLCNNGNPQELESELNRTLESLGLLLN